MFGFCHIEINAPIIGPLINLLKSGIEVPDLLTLCTGTEEAYVINKNCLSIEVSVRANLSPAGISMGQSLIQMSHSNGPRTVPWIPVSASNHIHNANFVQTQFSTSHLQKQHFLKSRKFTFLWKYLVCGLKFEISEYPRQFPYVTYSSYKYELKRMKTHEIRAKYFRPVFNSVHCSATWLMLFL